MALTMENQTINIKTAKITTNVLVEQISLQQLIDLAIDSAHDHIGLETRQELVIRGQDSIPVRIQIKKLCKATIANIESILNEVNNNSNIDIEILKSHKSRFLSSLSLLDRIQLEWQKHDLSLTKAYFN